MNIIAIDFETFYSQKYSLSKLTTEEYIRGAEFEVIGVSVKVVVPPYLSNIMGTYLPAQWFTGTHAEIKKFLDSFNMQDHIVVAHNAMFDMAILNWVFDIRPKKIADTLSMARAVLGTSMGSLSLASLAEHYGLGVKGTAIHNMLGMHRIDFSAKQMAEYGEYCVNDTELCYSIFFELAKGFPKLELDLIDLTIRMFTEPAIEINTPVLASHLDEIQRRKAALMAAVAEDTADLMSNPKFADALIRLGVEPPMKTSLRTGKETYAFAKTDEGMKALLNHANPLVQMLAAARIGVKSTLEETRTQRLIEIASRGLLPVPLRYYAAKTGRWGGCLVADTEVTVYNNYQGIETKRIVDVLADDLVWDGGEFVPHEGVVFSGFQEVIEWDGIRGTPEHVVFTEVGEISLHKAMQGEHRITAAEQPTHHIMGAINTIGGGADSHQD